MTTISKEAAADMLATNIEEIEFMCKREQLELIELPNVLLPQITMRSAVEMTGNAYKEDEPVAHLITFDEAAKKMGLALSSVKTYANQGKLRKDGHRVDAYSVDAYIESKTPKNGEEPYEYNDNFDMAEERALNAGKTPPEYENETEPPELTTTPPELTHEPLVDFTDFTGMEEHQQKDTGPNKETDDYLEKKRAELKKIEVSKEEERAMKAIGEDNITLSKKDFNAALSIASMRAELQVYRSMKSFERR